ncbi:TolC family protein [Cellulophaga lytica]|uniref:Outer membrane efflux protein n=1 Tax=Cellulophaga lytica (strain ATCC 23178 / DSM 7489 / JCM 8516 / NBRC 14961 / NCIMB 1423 / VKM B-1433 / Cy l20) TaxID=867900 RepID=F0RG36_CELLC|nr:TolC family protein [Cellulophaga lytica]ADY29002.1 outer membrane efflux protein [Cellulophaga lytica DSM 7489]AIM60047.1 transporter [Cellulophaga lytica]MDO6854972.1 TolC family protein [Cellulophaga lytica]WQG76825.1 TolC family protein [Cellulophaga lytica]
MNIKIKHILFLLLLVSLPSSAQQSWSLDECINYAITHNLELKNQEYTVASSKETHKQAVRNLLPSINGSASYDVRYGRSVDPNNNNIIDTDFFSNNYNLNSSLDIFRGFQRINSIKATKYIYKAVQEDAQQQKYLLAFRVMSAFYDIRFFQGALKIAKEQVSISDTNYSFVKKQLELGLIAQADMYEAESVLLTDKLAVTQAENQLAAAKLNLIQEMNLENVSTITLKADALDLKKVADTTLQTNTVYSKAQTFLPSIKAGQLKVKAAQKQVAIAKGGLYPSLSLFAGYGTGYYETNVDDITNEIISFKNQIRDNASRSIGLSMNIPISNKWSGRSEIKQQKIALQQAENNLKIQEQELYKLIQQLVQEKNALEVENLQSLKKLKAQELSFSIAQKKYEKEMISAVELYQAKVLYTTAQNENLQVQIRLKVNQSTLDFYNGLPVFTIN